MTASTASDRQLFERQAVSLVASWAAYAKGSAGASVQEEDGVSVCVFPTEPERSVYNNALLARGMDADRTEKAVSAMERLYRDAGIESYAAWVHETDTVEIEVLTGRGYTFDSSTRAMAMSLDDIKVPRPEIELAEGNWDEYLRIMEVPEGLLGGVDPDDFHVRTARLDGEGVGTSMAYDFDGDVGVYNVVTLPAARRRGIGTALTALHVYDARDRGCTTASLQSTEMAEGVYAAVGFRDLGRYLEYVK